MQDAGLFEREIPWRSPDRMLGALRGREWAVLLDSGGALERARYSFLYLDVAETLVVRGGRVWRDGRCAQGDGWDALRIMRRNSAHDVVGIASYGAGLCCEGVVSRHVADTPDMVVASFASVMVFDRLEERCWWRGSGEPPDAGGVEAVSPGLDFTSDRTRAQWVAECARVRDLIGAGDIFQANLTMRWHASVTEGFDALAAYAAMRRQSPAPFGAFFQSSALTLLSASVERFIALSADGMIETCPIKGTAALGAAQALAADPKENAENLMITDLMRNDIGRVCELGSVSVPQLAQVEAFTHVAHLVSRVVGRLKAQCDAVDLLEATMSPGSVTGAPKRRALEIIDALEVSERGAYCGTLFRIGADGAMDSSVIIRSAAVVGNRLSIGAGGGITWGSDPAREWDEMVLKAAALLRSFGA